MSVIVVTGASSGIGRALALRAARAGYDVVGIGRDTVALHELAAQVEREHGRVVTAALDVADPANAPAIVGLARERFGRIDVLVNNAGHVAVGPISQQTDDALRAQFGVHVIGPLALVREALSLLRAARGHVFMLGSGVARIPVGGLGAYPAAKAATRSASAILRRELHPDGIAVTYVDPGAVDTAFMTRAGMAGSPRALLASPEDVARKILVAVGTRPAVLNAVPWQTGFVALAERLPGITETVLALSPDLVGTQTSSAYPRDTGTAPPQATASPEPEPGPAIVRPPVPAAQPPSTISFDDAIEPVRRRMERVKLRAAFVRELLREDALLDPGEIALRWAGMPNKNERAATTEVLDALATAGFLVREDDGYRVLRGP